MALALVFCLELPSWVIDILACQTFLYGMAKEDTINDLSDLGNRLLWA